jgi:hypothetical protein
LITTAAWLLAMVFLAQLDVVRPDLDRTAPPRSFPALAFRPPDAAARPAGVRRSADRAFPSRRRR